MVKDTKEGQSLLPKTALDTHQEYNAKKTNYKVLGLTLFALLAGVCYFIINFEKVCIVIHVCS